MAQSALIIADSGSGKSTRNEIEETFTKYC